MTIQPAGAAEYHVSSTVHTLSRTPRVMSGAVYTPGAISSMQEARNPRKRSGTSRVTATVIGIEERLDPFDHAWNDRLLSHHPADAAAHGALKRDADVV